MLKKKKSIVGTYHKKKDFIKNSRIKYVHFDSSKPFEFNKISYKPTVIVHLSNKIFNSRMQNIKKNFDFYNNLLSMINILNFCRAKKVKKLIYVSSSTGYPKSINKLKESQYFKRKPISETYLIGWISRLLEKIIFIYKSIYNLKTKIVILRPSAIYGKYDNFDNRSSRLIPYLIKKIISNRSYVKIPGSGSLVRNWVNVSEFTNLIIKLIFFKSRKKIDIINISSDTNYSTLEITRKILRIIKKKIKIIKSFQSEKKLNCRILDNTKMKTMYLTVDNLTIDYHLKKTVDWYKSKI